MAGGELMRLTKGKGEITETGKKKLEEIRERMGLGPHVAEVPSSQSGSVDVRELILFFDATGSMTEVWHEAKATIQELYSRLQELVPGIAIGLMAYRDYCDRNRIIEFLPPSQDVSRMNAFIDQIECEGGGDAPEAVEVALERLLQTKATVAILVEDAPPHGVQDKLVGKDFRDVARQLQQQGITVYTVSTNEVPSTVSSFKEIAQITQGRFFNLKQMKELLDIFSAAVAIKTEKVPTLKALLKRRQGGQLTSTQKQLLGE